MLAGHVGAGSALSCLEPRLNVDVLHRLFVLPCLEQVTIPPDYEVRHQLAFVFPYSQGRVGNAVWSVLAQLVLGIKLAHTLGGLGLYLTREGWRCRDRGIVVLTLVVAAGTVFAMTPAPRPLRGSQLAASSQVFLVLLTGSAIWFYMKLAGQDGYAVEPKT